MDEEDSTSYERTMAEEASQESTSSVKRDDEKVKICHACFPAKCLFLFIAHIAGHF